jgi:hypothetical protein
VELTVGFRKSRPNQWLLNDAVRTEARGGIEKSHLLLLQMTFEPGETGIFRASFVINAFASTAHLLLLHSSPTRNYHGLGKMYLLGID